MKKIKLPLTVDAIKGLKAGDEVLLSGPMYVARDAAHKRGIKVPLKNETIFYAGPTPKGAIGPTTSSRMDPFTIPLLKRGLRGAIGKGERSSEVRSAFRKYKAVYFVATGGIAALLSKTVKKSKIIAYSDLGPEAILRIEVKDFPAWVAYDIYGGNIFD